MGIGVLRPIPTTSRSLWVSALSRVGIKAPPMIAVMAPLGVGRNRRFERCAEWGKTHPAIHNATDITYLPHMFYAEDEIVQALDTEPEGFDTGFAVALASEESAQLRDQADDFANRWRALRWLFLVEDIGACPFRCGEKQT